MRVGPSRSLGDGETPKSRSRVVSLVVADRQERIVSGETCLDPGISRRESLRRSLVDERSVHMPEFHI
ncbi:hypothetical protein BC826DRAFT_1013039, partial [Russula brevipes]